MIVSLNPSTYAQLDSNNNYCLRSNKELATKEFVKSIKITYCSGIDTTIDFISVDKGNYKSHLFPNNSRHDYFFDNTKKLLLKTTAVIYDDNQTTNTTCHCNYDKNGMLLKIIQERKTANEKLTTDTDFIYYLKGQDSIKYVGKFYSKIIYNKSEGTNIRNRFVCDTIGNIELKEIYIDNRLITSRSFNKGKEESGEYFIYDEVGKLKIHFFQVDEKVDMTRIQYYIEYSYDEYKRVIKEQEYSGDSKLLSEKYISYNDRGLKEKTVEWSPQTNTEKTYLYKYEYWK